MKWNDPQRLDRLAGEYVLGTLQGAARRRLEREIPANRMLRARVQEWELQFAPLVLAVPPVSPPSRVWRGIAKDLGAGDSREGLWRHLGFWRGLGLLASSMAVLLLVYFASHQSLFFKTTPAYVAVMSDAKARATWMLSASSDMRKLQVKTVAAMQVAPDQSMELWMLPSDGSAPMSLGLLPTQGGKSMTLNAEQAAILKTAKGLAVSLEPAGGSPTGAPTGPVQYQGVMFSLI